MILHIAGSRTNLLGAGNTGAIFIAQPGIVFNSNLYLTRIYGVVWVATAAGVNRNPINSFISIQQQTAADPSIHASLPSGAAVLAGFADTLSIQGGNAGGQAIDIAFRPGDVKISAGTGYIIAASVNDAVAANDVISAVVELELVDASETLLRYVDENP